MTYSQEKDAEEYNELSEPEPPRDRWGTFLMVAVALITIAGLLFNCGG